MIQAIVFNALMIEKIHLRNVINAKMVTYKIQKIIVQVKNS